MTNQSTTPEAVSPKSYDGLYFGNKSGEQVIEIFKHTLDRFLSGVPEKFELGFMYHIIVYHPNREGQYVVSEPTEAVLIDPVEYSRGLSKSGLFGWIVKKTDVSQEFTDGIMNSLSIEIQKANDKISKLNSSK